MIAIRINKKSDIPEHFQYIMGNMPADNTIIVFISGDPVLKLAFQEFAKMYASYALKLRAVFHVYIEDKDKRGLMLYDKTVRINFGAYDDDKNYMVEQRMFSDGRDVFPINKETLSIKIIHEDVEMDPNKFPVLIEAFKSNVIFQTNVCGLPIMYAVSKSVAHDVIFEYIYEGGVNFTITNVEVGDLAKIDKQTKDEVDLYKWLSKPFFDRIKERYVITDYDDFIVIQNTIIDSGVNVMVEGFEPIDDLVIKALNYSKAQRRFKAQQEAARKEQLRKEKERKEANAKNAMPHFPNIWRDYIAHDCVGGCYTGAFYESDTAEYDRDGTPILFHGVKL